MSNTNKKFYVGGFMDLSSYHLKKVDNYSSWDELVDSSKEGTIFSKSVYLNALQIKPEMWFCYKNNSLKAGVIFIDNGIKDSYLLEEALIYNGIIFTSHPPEQNTAQIMSEKFRIISFIAQELTKIHPSFFMSFHPMFLDIRPFMWFNYGNKLPKYNIEVRFTSFLNIMDFKDVKSLENNSLYKSSSKSRRQEIRYALKKGVITKVGFEMKLFEDFYQKTMTKQGMKIDGKLLHQMKCIVDNLYNNDKGQMFISYTASGEPGSIAFIGYDTKRAYYLWGANDPMVLAEHTGTAILWDAFKTLSNMGMKEIDLEGVNSPRRGWFKLSFGGSLVPYYHVSYQE